MNQPDQIRAALEAADRALTSSYDFIEATDAIERDYGDAERDRVLVRIRIALAKVRSQLQSP